jgi:hypothetical protein
MREGTDNVGLNQRVPFTTIDVTTASTVRRQHISKLGWLELLQLATLSFLLNRYVVTTALSLCAVDDVATGKSGLLRLHAHNSHRYIAWTYTRTILTVTLSGPISPARAHRTALSG